MASKRSNGEGTIYRRKDGRYEAAVYVFTASGGRKRVRVYANTRAEVHEKLVAFQRQGHQGIPVADESKRLDEYLDFWLAGVVQSSKRPRTYDQYAWVTGRFLKPDLGPYKLDRLTVLIVQRWLDRKHAEGHSAHRIRLLRSVLSAALTSAQRQDLVQRNVARLVELPSYEAKERIPWTGEEAKRFLTVAADHELYPAYLLLLSYGLRRGEVLGLRWRDVDFENGVLRIRNQLQRFAGAFHEGSVKTRAGQRDLPLLGVVREALLDQQAMCRELWPDAPSEGLVFRTVLGKPIDPDSFRVTFQRLAKRNGLRVIAIHDIRHTTATLLKDLGVPARDAQLILGHSDITTTQQIYQHASYETRREALERVEKSLVDPGNCLGSNECMDDSERCRQNAGCRQDNGSVAAHLVGLFTSVNDGAPGGIRTPGLWYRNSNLLSLRERVTGVERLLRVRRKQWVVGLVAVSVAVRFRPAPLGEVALLPLMKSGGSSLPR